MARAVILDVDGTLVDTNYHHVVAWSRAFARHGYAVPPWRIHRIVGMGGDQLVAELAGKGAEADSGDDIRDTESEIYGQMIMEVRALEGARELIHALKARGSRVVLASSAPSDEVEHYVSILGVQDEVDGWTTSSDVDRTKPEPDLVEAAIGKAGTRDCVLVGDTVWDMKAASRASVPAIAVTTGGISAAELRDAGAAEVYESVAELQAHLGDSLLTRGQTP